MPFLVTTLVATPLSLKVILAPVVISDRSFKVYSVSLVGWNRVRRAIMASSKGSWVRSSHPGTSVALAV